MAETRFAEDPDCRGRERRQKLPREKPLQKGPKPGCPRWMAEARFAEDPDCRGRERRQRLPREKPLQRWAEAKLSDLAEADLFSCLKSVDLGCLGKEV